MGKFQDLAGQKFYKWRVLERVKKHPKKTHWLCECDCGNQRLVIACDLKNGNHKSCGKCHYHIFIQNSFWGEIQKQAKRRGYEFSLTKDYLYDLWIKQDGKCAISGVKLHMPAKAREQRGPKCTASIDRIDNAVGYVVNNVQWVLKDVNRMRREYTIEDYISICKKVAIYQESMI